MAGVYDDFAPIIARLEEQCPDFEVIGSPSRAQNEADSLLILPCCYVFPGPSKPSPNGNPLALVLEDQEWRVFIAVPYYANADADLEISLGELVLSVIAALNHWTPSGSAGQLIYQERSPVNYDEGYADIQLRFSQRKMLTET